MDEIYLATSPSWEKGKSNIKIGRSCNSEKRKKTYNTHNPEIGFLAVFQTPSEIFSRYVERSLLFSINRLRVSSTEWYKVDEEKFNSFLELKTLKDVLVFCRFETILTLEEEINECQFIDKEIKEETYKKNLQTYKKIRKELEMI